MKTIRLHSLLPAAVLLISVSCRTQEPTTGVTAPERPGTLDVIHARTSIRTYIEQPVSRDTLELLVRAGMAAPSAMNKQPWQFVVVQDPEVLDALGEDLPTSRMVRKAPAAIIVCGDLEKAGEGWLQQYWIQDCSAVSQNILLAATELGLGAVWTSVYPAPERMELVSGILSLPEQIVPLNIIPIGYPDQEYPPKEKWDPERIHWNKF
ncbi:MAG: nitroreductase family protein [Rikenellaceae bacterium]|nr:nitroreductase family protein [Rikenellaceae bacterium]